MLEEIEEQHEAKRLLASALPEGPAHAYLFHGPSGVGKTRAALYLARALLCDSRLPDGSPCGSCESCRLALRLGHPDLQLLVPLPTLTSCTAP